MIFFSHKTIIILAIFIASFLITCNVNNTGQFIHGSDSYKYFPKLNMEILSKTPGIHLIKDFSISYQQSTDYTCGPAVLLNLAAFYKKSGFTPDIACEMRIAGEAGTRSLDVIAQGDKPGTTPAEMKKWLEDHGFKVTLEYEDKGNGEQLTKLQSNLKNNIPTIVEWANLGGHYVIVVGYDTRNNDDPWDDVLIFADPFDKYDDFPDGYTYVNANIFYWLWYDAFYFDKLTWRTMITAIPVN